METNMNDVTDVELAMTPEEREKQRLEELNHPNFRKWFKGLLEVATIELTFFKQDGTERKMRCTLNERDIPEDKKPKGSSKKSPEDSIAVYDLEKEDWRSFRYDSIKEFEWYLEDSNEYPSSPMPVFFDENGNEIIETEEETKGE